MLIVFLYLTSNHSSASLSNQFRSFSMAGKRERSSDENTQSLPSISRMQRDRFVPSRFIESVDLLPEGHNAAQAERISTFTPVRDL